MERHDGARDALRDQKQKEKIAKKERAAANKLEKQRRSELYRQGLTLDNEVCFVLLSTATPVYCQGWCAMFSICVQM